MSSSLTSWSTLGITLRLLDAKRFRYISLEHSEADPAFEILREGELIIPGGEAIAEGRQLEARLKIRK